MLETCTRAETVHCTSWKSCTSWQEISTFATWCFRKWHVTSDKYTLMDATNLYQGWDSTLHKLKKLHKLTGRLNFCHLVFQKISSCATSFFSKCQVVHIEIFNISICATSGTYCATSDFRKHVITFMKLNTRALHQSYTLLKYEIRVKLQHRDLEILNSQIKCSQNTWIIIISTSATCGILCQFAQLGKVIKVDEMSTSIPEI